MSYLLKLALRWIGRRLVSLIWIILILVSANFIHSEYQEYESTHAELAALRSGEADLKQFRDRLRSETSQRMAELEKASVDKLRARVATLDGEIRKKKGALEGLGKQFILSLGKGIVEKNKLELEIRVLEAEPHW